MEKELPLREPSKKAGSSFQSPEGSCQELGTLASQSAQEKHGVSGDCEKMSCTHQTCFAFLCLLSGSAERARMVETDCLAGIALPFIEASPTHPN